MSREVGRPMEEWPEEDRVRMSVLQMIELPAAQQRIEAARGALILENEVARGSGDLRSGFGVLASQAQAVREFGKAQLALAAVLEETVAILRRNNPEAESTG